MSEIWVALVSGSMALLGVGISSLISYTVAKNEKKLERDNKLLEKKEELYLKIIKILEIPEMENQYLSAPMNFDVVNDDPYNIEAQLQLYVSQDILKKYHCAYEALEADLSPEVQEKRCEVLLAALKTDLKINS